MSVLPHRTMAGCRAHALFRNPKILLPPHMATPSGAPTLKSSQVSSSVMEVVSMRGGAGTPDAIHSLGVHRTRKPSHLICLCCCCCCCCCYSWLPPTVTGTAARAESYPLANRMPSRAHFAAACPTACLLGAEVSRPRNAPVCCRGSCGVVMAESSCVGGSCSIPPGPLPHYPQRRMRRL
jgi:hypothetical protein